jgi:hypothetical protein
VSLIGQASKANGASHFIRTAMQDRILSITKKGNNQAKTDEQLVEKSMNLLPM